MSELNFDFLDEKDLIGFSQTLDGIPPEIAEDKSIESMILSIPTIESIKPGFLAYETEIKRWEDDLSSLEVISPPTKELAITIGAAAQKVKAAIKKRRDEIWNPYLDFRKKLDGFADSFVSRLEAITFTSKEKQRPYDAKIEMERIRAEKAAQEATAKVQEQVNQEAAALGVPPIKVEAPIVPPKPKKVKTESGFTAYEVRSWIFELIDESKIARKFLSPDKKKIDQAIEEGLREGMEGSEGLHIFEKVETRYR